MKKYNKKYILAIETTGKICGVSLSCDERLISEININNGLTHSVTLFKAIDNILKNNNILAKDLSLICVSAGPGSFTGIRIGIAAALGIAKPYNTKISYIDTLDSLAYNVKNKANIIISMMDAKANRVFMSIYKSNSLKKLLADSIYNIDDLINCLNTNFTGKNINFIFVGDGVEKYRTYLISNLKINYVFAEKKSTLQKASSLLFVKGKTTKKVNINYLLKSKAERERATNEN